MAIQTYEGQFMTGVGAPGTTVAITGLPFQPECIIFFSMGEPDAVERTDSRSADAGWGFATSPTVRRCEAASFRDGAGDTGGRQVRNDAIYAALDNGGNITGQLDLNSIQPNGFTVIIDDQFLTTCCVHYIAIKGYSHYAIGDSTIPAATGNQAIVALGFRPCGVLFGAGYYSAGFNAPAGGQSCLGIGAAIDAGHQGQMSLGHSGTGAWSSRAKRYMTATECMSVILDPNNPGPYARATFVSEDVDGFTVNWLEVNAGLTGDPWIYLAFGGPDGNLFVGNLTSRADGLDIPVGTGFMPAGLLFFSHQGPLSAADTQEADAKISIGAASSAAQRSVVSAYGENAVGAADWNIQQYVSEIYASSTAVPAVDGLMDVKSFDPAGFTAVMDDADAGTAVVFFVAFGPANWESRRRVVTYTRDTMDPDPRLKDANGVYLDPWECHADAWVKFLGVFSPTTNVPASLVDDPEAGYIEELGWDSESEGPKFFTSRMDLGETVIAQAAAKSAS